MHCHELVSLSLPSIPFIITIKYKAMARNYIEQFDMSKFRIKFSCLSNVVFYLYSFCLFVTEEEHGSMDLILGGNHVYEY